MVGIGFLKVVRESECVNLIRLRFQCIDVFSIAAVNQ